MTGLARPGDPAGRVRLVPRIGQSQEAAQPFGGSLFDGVDQRAQTFAHKQGIFRGDRALTLSAGMLAGNGIAAASDANRSSQTLLALVGWAIAQLAPDFARPAPDSFGWVSALGGASLARFLPDASKPVLFDNARIAARATRKVMRRARWGTFCTHWTLTHGEAATKGSERNVATVDDLRRQYAEMLDTVVDAYGTMFREELALKRTPAALLTQVGGPARVVPDVPDRYMAGVALAQIDIARRRADVVLAGPTWDCQVGDNVHRSPLGRMVEAEREAVARLVGETGKSWHPLWGIGPVERQGHVLRWRFALPPVPGARAILLSPEDRWNPSTESGFIGRAHDVTFALNDIRLVDDGVSSNVAQLEIALPPGSPDPTMVEVALSPITPVPPDGRPFSRSRLFCTTDIASPFARQGFDVPPMIRWPVMRDQASVADLPI